MARRRAVAKGGSEKRAALPAPAAEPEQMEEQEGALQSESRL